MSKRIVVTGAASGLGRATACHLAAQGHAVHLVDLPNKGHADLCGTLDNGTYADADITSEEDVKHALDASVLNGATIGGLVHCAGVAYAQKVIGRTGAAHGLDTFKWVVDTNLIGTFNVARLAAKEMANAEPDTEGSRGAIILTASVAAFDGQKGQVAYAATKGAVASMVLPMARDLAPLGIRGACIAPGVFETPMMALLTQEKKDALAAHVPFQKRLGKPHEFALLAEHILNNPLLNGEVIRLDGALRLP